MKINNSIIYISGFFFIIFAAFSIYYLTDGNYSSVGNDFPFYFNRLVYIRDFNIPFAKWFSQISTLEIESINIDRVSNWIPSPFYSLIFIGPFFLIKSNLLFIFQGILITFSTFCLFYSHLKSIYGKVLSTKMIGLVMLIGCLNLDFLKDIAMKEFSIFDAIQN